MAAMYSIHGYTPPAIPFKKKHGFLTKKNILELFKTKF